MLSPRLHNLLDAQHAPYTPLSHERSVTALDTAAAAHVRRELFAKTVMLKIDGALAMMVMPETVTGKPARSRLWRAVLPPTHSG